MHYQDFADDVEEFYRFIVAVWIFIFLFVYEIIETVLLSYLIPLNNF